MSPLAVGINILSAEDNRTAREDYTLHMKMVDFLHGKYPNVKIALHAGELDLGLVPPEDLRFHIQEAVEVGHACRIGHGVDIMRECNSQKTLSEMRNSKIAIEIMPVSNKDILGVSGEDHPFPVYLSRGVPIVLASDDPGVLRTNLTEQFVIISGNYPQVSYSDIKTFARNSLEYGFLRGEGIWAEAGNYSQIRKECAGCLFRTECEECRAFLDKNDKAKAEWRHEGDLASFEESILG
jgi:adenosine deaminase